MRLGRLKEEIRNLISQAAEIKDKCDKEYESPDDFMEVLEKYNKFIEMREEVADKSSWERASTSRPPKGDRSEGFLLKKTILIGLGLFAQMLIEINLILYENQARIVAEPSRIF